jgi:CRP-like cAMP-binding protein
MMMTEEMSVSPCADVLRATPLFAGLRNDQLAVVAPPCRRMPAHRNQSFFCEREEAARVFVLLKGEVCLEVELSLGRELPPRIIEVEQLGANDVFGLCALLEPRRSSLTARCKTEADIIAIDAADLKARMRAQPAIGLLVMENVCRITRERLMRAQERLISELGLAAMYAGQRNY